MTDSSVFNHTARLLDKATDISANRHTQVARKTAAMDTNGQTPGDLDFSQTLIQAMAAPQPDDFYQAHSGHPSQNTQNRPFLMEGEDAEDVGIHRLETVNIDREMINLTQNNIQYRTSTELLLKKMKTLQYSIIEGGE